MALVEAVAQHTERDPVAPEEVGRIATAAAAQHFYNPATGAVGRDAGIGETPVSGGMPWHAIDVGIGVGGLS